MMSQRGDGRHMDNSVICENFGDFQQVLKNMRTIDDRIMYALNTAIPTESFASTTDPQGLEQCKKISDDLEQSQKERLQTIRTCIDLSAQRVQDLKARAASPDAAKQIRQAQNNVRMMQTELNVEEVLRDRANKILHDRCRFYLKESNFKK